MVVGPKLLRQTTKKVNLIQERIKASQSRHKSYVDQRRRRLEFAAGDHVFLRITPTTSVGRAIRSRKLSPKFIGPYQILKRIGPVAYEIALPPQLSNLHSVFHVSQLESMCLILLMCLRQKICRLEEIFQWRFSMLVLVIARQGNEGGSPSV